MRIPTPTQKTLRELWEWRPQPRQADFLRACGVLEWFLDDAPLRPALAPIIGYGGAAGGGKSDAFLALSLILCFAYPGLSVSYFRRKYSELEGPEGVIERSKTLFSALGSYNDGKHRWVFPNGSKIYFRHVHNETDKHAYQSQAFNLLLLDEATHFTWSIVDYLITRNRAPSMPGYYPFAAMASNPGNIGHGWYSGLFDITDHSGGDDGAHNQKKHRLTANGKYEDIYFVPARLEDNAILMRNDPDYERKLTDRDPDLAQALRYGNWQTFSGMVFKAWQRSRHVVKPALPAPHWVKWRAVDWGYRAPFCCLWFTRNPDTGRIFVYRELYQTGLTDRQQARMIRDMTPPGEKISITYADPSMWAEKNRDGAVFSTADEYGKEGVLITPADNSRMNGKRKVDKLLADLPDGMPGIQITEDCENLIRTLPLLAYSETGNVEDVDSQQEDHAYDTLRYGLTNTVLPDLSQARQKDSPLMVWEKLL